MKRWVMVGAAAVLSAAAAEAKVLNFTGTGNYGLVNGAHFLRWNAAGVKPGDLVMLDTLICSTGGTVESGCNDNTWEKDDLALKPFGKTGPSYQFLLDIQEPWGPHRTVSLDELRVYVSDQEGLTAAELPTKATLVYDLDAGADSTVIMDAARNSTGRPGDLLVFIPTSNFPQAGNPHIYLYSKLGQNAPAQGGAEKWYVINYGQMNSTPEPGTALLMVGVAGLVVRRRR